MAGKINKGKVIAAAQKYVQKGQHDKAIREYAKVVEEDPRDVRIWLKIGDLYAKKGSKEQAVDTYLKVAEFYSEQGFYLKAVAVYKQILKLNPTLVDVNLRLAELYKQLGLLNDAMQQYEVVSGHFHQAGRTRDALAALRQIVDLDPENVASRIKLAELYSKESMRGEAVEEFAKAADFLRAQDRLDDFVKVAERLIYHQPDNLGITKELASLYLRRHDPRRALQKLQVAFKADPRAEDTLEMLAQAFRDLGQLPKTVSVWKELAQIHAENGQVAKQKDLYRRVLEVDPNDGDAKKALQEPAPASAAAPPPPPPPVAAAPPPVPSTSGRPLATPPAPPASPYAAQVAHDPYGEASGTYGDESYDHGYRHRAGVPQWGEASGNLRASGGWNALANPPTGDTYAPPPAKPPEWAQGYLAEDYAQAEFVEQAPEPPNRVVEEFSYDATTATSDLEYESYGGVVAKAQAVKPPGGESLADEVARVLTEAEVYIKYGLHDKAADHLRQIFARDPSNIEVRLRLKDLHAQLGRYGEAALELYSVGRYLAEHDPRAAAQHLNEALELDPQNNAARQLLMQLEEGSGLAPSGRERPTYAEGALTSGDYGAIDLDAEDIVEEIPIDVNELDEGYGTQTGADISVPSDPGDPQGAYDDARHSERIPTGSGVIEVHGETTDTLGHGTPASEIIQLPAEGSGVTAAQQRVQLEEEATTSSLEDDLEEADFFIQQSLFAEARAILDDLLVRYPNHPLVEAKLADIDSAPVADAFANVSDHGHGLAEIASDIAQSFDNVAGEATSAQASDGYSVADVFDDIKRSVDSQVSEEDSDTHYDLGIAYREMGLLDDAIAEFKVAMRSREKEVLCHMMIGLCCSEKGMISEAISQFKTGLYVEGITERETIALYFELGQAYEKLDDLQEALYYYEKVAKKDPRFRDVERHVHRLRRATGERGNGSPAAGSGGAEPGGGGASHRALSDETDVSPKEF
ncbi:MAG: hypothetical protein CSA65_01930 [Proteobacteria bacterium]|nr:MAG: hypothetical protein CSA65_01930 [Pseudomonadota bacterium]